MTNVVGLPTTVKVALEALLNENKLTSWKVAAEGRNTVVVLRLTGSSSATIATSTSIDQRFRRKPPSQLRRDARRAEQRNNLKRQDNEQQQASETEFRPTPLFSPSTEKLSPNEKGNCVADENIRYQQGDISESPVFTTGDTAREFRDEKRQAVCAAIHESVSQPLNDMRVAEPCDLKTATVSQNCDVNTEYSVEDEDSFSCDEEGAEGEWVIEEKAERAGFSLDTIHSEISQVFDKQKQDKLRDNQRNHSVCKMVRDKRYNKRVLVCESDDLVLRYDVREQKTTHWYINMYKPMVTELEDYTVRCLRRWTPLGNEDFVVERERAAKDLNALAVVIRLYLG